MDGRTVLNEADNRLTSPRDIQEGIPTEAAVKEGERSEIDFGSTTRCQMEGQP